MPILTDDERLGTTLAGKYELSAILGSGGMGTVFEARHAWTGRRVAVKLLKAVLANEPNVRTRFLREARAAAALEHPNAVSVLDMGETEDGTVFLVLERLEGRTLADVLAERGTLSVDETLSVLVPVIDALAAAHEQGFLHRDVKPENIFLTASPDGVIVPKLLDFGLAKALEAGPESVKTATGHVLGTPHYMSPEQASGARELGPPTDVWSVGVVLFECLSGQLPFGGETLTSVLLGIVSAPAPALASRAPDVDAATAAVVDRALVKDPRERVPSMAALREALLGATRSEGAPSGRVRAALTPRALAIALPATRVATPTPDLRRRRALPWAIALGLVGLGLASAAAWVAWTPAPIDAPTPTPPAPVAAPVVVDIDPPAPIAEPEPAVSAPVEVAQPVRPPRARPAPESEPERPPVRIRTEWQEGPAAPSGASERPTVRGW